MSITSKEKLSSRRDQPLRIAPLNSSQRKKLFSLFCELYPNPESELNYENPFQLLCAVILSAQCTDKKVNEVTPDLFSSYPDFFRLSRAKLSALERILRPVNYYKSKARHLQAMAKLVCDEFNGTLPTSHEGLTRLPGVGRKTANVVLSELGLEEHIAVDTHVFRLSHRIGLSAGKTPRDVEEDLMKSFPKKNWRVLHHSLILHGRRVCPARKPLCSLCSLKKICQFPDKEDGGIRDEHI